MTGVIVHEWMERFGGAEQVVHAMARVFPDAPIVCAWNDAPQDELSERVSETWLARTPLRRNKMLALPFMLQAWRDIPAAEAEWILCSSHLFAHHARIRHHDVPKFVFAHTPARYIWEPELDGRGMHLMARASSGLLRRVDRTRAQEAVKIAAVSRFVAERIERTWDRESTVVHPPVDVGAFGGPATVDLTDDEHALLETLPTSFVLGASRFVRYKRLDLAIASGVAADVPVVIAGDGPERARLQAMADDHPGQVTFVRQPSTRLLRALYERSLVYVFGAVEDFGIMPVEAMATGTPVVAAAVGGASETIVDGVTGAHFRSEDATELRRAVALAVSTAPADSRARAWEFDESVFAQRLRDWMSVAHLP